MNTYELPAMIEDELPVIAAEIKHLPLDNVREMIKIVAQYARKKMSMHDIPAVINCMQAADKIYKKGNAAIKQAIENVFVLSFPTLSQISNKMEWNDVQAKMPMTLFSIYVRQRRDTAF